VDPARREWLERFAQRRQAVAVSAPMVTRVGQVAGDELMAAPVAASPVIGLGKLPGRLHASDPPEVKNTGQVARREAAMRRPVRSRAGERSSVGVEAQIPDLLERRLASSARPARC